MYRRVRAAVLVSAVLAALVPCGGAAALATHAIPAVSRATAGQSLTWAIVPSANRNPGGDGHSNQLNDISCVSAGACTAVGWSTFHAFPKTLIETWNGAAWSLMPSPNRSSDDFLYSVSCASASACTAVGNSSSRHLPPRTLIESWNGTAWSVVPSPNAQIVSVSCVSADFCTAVGGYGKTQIESWNGTAWSIVPSPNAGQATDVNVLMGVSCATADSCTAAGYYLVPGAKVVQPTLIESWDGTAWSVVPSPNPPKSFNSLNGVSCLSATVCMAAGWRNDPVTHGIYQTITELGTSAG
jgi:hypothetical protein